QSEQGERQPDAEVHFLAVRAAATVEDPCHEQPHQARERTQPVALPPATKRTCQKSDHAALITATMSRATLTVSTSSTRCKNECSSDCPRIWRTFSTESCVMTVPWRRINTSEQTFSTTSSTCEQ